MTTKNKTLKLSDAYKAIDNAMTILRELEMLADKSASGECIHLTEVVSRIHTLRSHVDQTLIGFVESQVEVSE